MNLALHAELLRPMNYVRFSLGETVFPISVLDSGLTNDNGVGVTFNNIGAFAKWIQAVEQGQPPVVLPTPNPEVLQILMGNSDDFQLIAFFVSRDELPNMLNHLNGLVLDMWQAQNTIKVYAN